MEKLSVVTIAKNEEKNIEKFLSRLNWVDEIVVVDNGSTDRTAKYAKNFTDSVYSFEGNHFGELKQFAVSKATGDWILVLDVDEHITAMLKKEIKSVLRSKIDYKGYEILRVGYFLNHRLHAKGFHEYKVRLFKRELGCLTQVPVHEEVVVQGKIGRLRGEITHYSYRSVGQTIAKLTRYARLEAPLFYAKGDRVTFKKFTLYPLHMFWEIFIKDQGYKDGIWGFGLAVCFAYYEFARYFFLFMYRLKTLKIREENS